MEKSVERSLPISGGREIAYNIRISRAYAIA